MPHLGYFPPREFPKPLSISPGAFVPMLDTYDWDIGSVWIRPRASLESQGFQSSVLLPYGAVVEKLGLHGYRVDADSRLSLELRRVSLVGIVDSMALVEADWTTGASVGYDASINYPVIDNRNYRYCLQLVIDPNDAITDCWFWTAVIVWN